VDKLVPILRNENFVVRSEFQITLGMNFELIEILHGLTAINLLIDS